MKSYIIDAEIKDNHFSVDIDVAKDMLEKVYDSPFTPKENTGLEKAYTFENNEGLGTLYTYKNKIIHWSYFKSDENKIIDEFNEIEIDEMIL